MWDALHIHTSGEPTIFMGRSRIYNADKKKAEVDLTWKRWSSIEEGYCQWDRRWITFSVTACQESVLFSNAMFRYQNIISLVPTGRSLFIPWGGGDHLIFRRTKGGISRNWEPKRRDHWKLWKDHGTGGTAQICLENEDIGWEDRDSHQMFIRGDHFSEVTLKGGVFLVTHQF